MKVFEIKRTETLGRIVHVKAEDRDEALEIADRWFGVYPLDFDDYEDTDTEVLGVSDDESGYDDLIERKDI